MDLDIFKNFRKGEAERARRVCANCGEANDDSVSACVRCGHALQPLGVRKCEKGHTVDPNWTECYYCAAEKQRTAQAQAPRNPGPDRNRTRVEPEDSPSPFPSGNSSPAVSPGQSPQPEFTAPADNSRIVGVLITYTRRKQGEVFPIREGKNYIGSGNIKGTNQACDIWFPEDAGMSGEHALILCRPGEFLIFDQQSSNGTKVNGKSVHFRGEELPNYAEIKAGAVKFTFIKAEAHAAAAAAPEPLPWVADDPPHPR